MELSDISKRMKLRTATNKPNKYSMSKPLQALATAGKATNKITSGKLLPNKPRAKTASIGIRG